MRIIRYRLIKLKINNLLTDTFQYKFAAHYFTED